MKNLQISNNLKLKILGFIIACILLVLYFMSACAQKTETGNEGYYAPIEYQGLSHHDNYKLEQMTVISRHNVRSPITNEKSLITKETPHQWFNWTSGPGELSLLGGQYENYLGQYFRKYLANEGMAPENWIPQQDEAYFYSNSRQRTIATAKHFATAMMPTAEIKINHKYDTDKHDTFFAPAPTNITESLKNQINKEFDELGGSEGRDGINNSLQESKSTLENIIDFKDSEYAKSNNIESLPNEPNELILKEGESADTKGLIHNANDLADALSFQYLEEQDDTKAGFGHKINFDMMSSISKFMTMNMKTTSGLHTLACNGMQPLLSEIQSDINNQNRKFSFYCGHDNTITAILAALEAKEYILPNTFTNFAPISAKLVFSKFKDKNGEYWIDLKYLYPSTKQIRNREQINLENAPVAYPIELDGIEKNSEGLYKVSDIQKRITKALEWSNQFK